MIPLRTQEEFEALYRPALPNKAPILIYFTANWCGACKRLDWAFLTQEFPNLTIYKCDVDENKYTPGFCGVRSIPAFTMVHTNGTTQGPFVSSDTAKVASWIFTQIKGKA